MTVLARRAAGLPVALAAIGHLTGCHAIQSSAVRELIDREGEKISAAQDNVVAFEKATQARNAAIDDALKNLDDAIVELRASEAIIAVVYSANQSAADSRGADAEAIAYMAARTYLDSEGGLAESVRDQFDVDKAAMTAIAQQLRASWDAIAEHHAQIAEYSKKGAAAGVDPAALGAILAESGVAMKLAQRTVRRGEQVEKAIATVDDRGLLDDTPLAGSRRYLNELITLLRKAGVDGTDGGQ